MQSELKNYNPKIIFAGSSEEYGLIITSKEQYEHCKSKYKNHIP